MIPLLLALKSKVSCALEGQLTMVALDQHPILASLYCKFHAVAALYLEGNVICSEIILLRMSIHITLMVSAYLRPFGNDCRIYR